MTPDRAAPVFHVGYPKAGSTTLNGLNRCPPFLDGMSDPYRLAFQGLYDYLFQTAPIAYEKAKAAECLASMQHLMQLHGDAGKALFLSCERATSVFYSFPCQKTKALRIRDLLPSARILIVVRNQLELFKSLYRDEPFDPRGLEVGRSVDANAWVDLDRGRRGLSFLHSLKYDAVIDLYVTLFGRENVFVCLFEGLFAEDPGQVAALAQFLGVGEDFILARLTSRTVNRGRSRLYGLASACKRGMLPRVRIPDRTRAVIATALNAFPRRRVELSRDRLELFAELFGPSNSRLQREHGLDVLSWGYPGAEHGA
jgi:hypothetical protein